MYDRSARHWPLVLVALFSVLFTLDLYLHPGEPATFDGPIHITNIAMYKEALLDGEFPVSWADGFANYGLPTPLLSQQLTSYLGAIVSMIVLPEMAFTLLATLGTFIGAFGMYQWLVGHVKYREHALVGVLLFTLTAYRISNLYIRGALPELFAMSLFPWLLLAIERVVESSRNIGVLLLVLVLLILSHPFMFFLSMILAIPYAVYTIYFSPDSKANKTILLLLITGLSLAICAWYLLPLLIEIKYFVISRNDSQLVSDQFLELAHYFSEQWPYFYQNDVFVRGNVVQFGVVESAILVLAPLILVFGKLRDYRRVMVFFGIASLGIVFMTTSAARFLYAWLPLLHGIQFPWRFLAVLSVVPPLYASILFEAIPYKLRWGGLLCLVIFLGMRVPQLYGKNYVQHDPDHYKRTIKNLHFDSLNTVWIGNTQTYPVKEYKGEIIEGRGEILSRDVKNSERTYMVHAEEPVRLADYTFYFPGWHVYVDDEDVPIEFQDVSYRGVITYHIPEGTHEVRVVFEPTRVRMLGYALSLLALATSVSFVIVIRSDHLAKLAW